MRSQFQNFGRLSGAKACTKSLGPLFEFDADPLDIDSLFLPVPRDALDPNMGEIAAKAAVALD